MTYELAGLAGVDPGPLTLRALAAMAEARGRQSWAQTSILAAPAWNAVRDPKRRPRPFRPADFNPYEQNSGGAGRLLFCRANRKIFRSLYRRKK